MCKSPTIVGITGGIGAGKSELVRALARRGASVFSADKAVHELYDDKAVIAAVTERWSDNILDSAQRVDKKKIAKIVFSDVAERKWLENLLHPLVGKKWFEFVSQQQNLDDPPKLIVAEVPLLFEADLADRYDFTVTVSAPYDLRMQRVEHRTDGRSLPNARAATQMSSTKQVELADLYYENTGSIDDLEKFAEQVIMRVRN